MSGRLENITPINDGRDICGKTERRKHSEHLHYLDKTYFASSLEAKMLCPTFFSPHLL